MVRLMFCWTQYATDLCRLAAPRELANRPVYVLDADRESLPLPEHAAGFTSFHLDRVLRPHLESTGRWAGPGFATVVSPKMQGSGESQALLESRAIVCAIHELGHHIEHLAIDAAVQESGLGSLADVVPSENYVAYATHSIGAPSCEPWRGHGLAFVRSFLHLVHRLRQHGCNLVADDRAAGSVYGLSPLVDYSKALGDEPGQHIEQSLVDVLRTPAPVAMVDLFERDTMAFRARAAA